MSTEDPDLKAEMPELDLWWSGRKRRSHGSESASRVTVRIEPRNVAGRVTMEAVVSRENLLLALRAVERNRGVDGMTTGQLRQHWEQNKAQLLAGSYQPHLVRRVDIPKPGGGTRMLGIPTVRGRLIQQALHQVMSLVWEPDFSDHRYGFRPGRGAHGAVAAARAHVEGGHRWGVDLDLEKFFDRVNHDVLMARVERKVDDRRVLGLIRRYLQSAMMGGLVEPRLKVAARSVARFKDKVRQLVRQGRGRNLERFIGKNLTPVVRGWANDYRKATRCGLFEALDRWLRRKLRCLIWRRWKRVHTRRPSPDRPGVHGGQGVVQCLSWARSVVERGCLAHECGLPRRHVPADGTGLSLLATVKAHA